MPAHHQRLVQQGRCGAGSLLRLRHSHRRRPQAGGIGIDGIINFFNEDAKGKKKPQAVAAQVKSGKVNSGQIRDLKGVVGGWYKSLTRGKKYRRL